MRLTDSDIAKVIGSLEYHIYKIQCCQDYPPGSGLAERFEREVRATLQKFRDERNLRKARKKAGGRCVNLANSRKLERING